MFFYKKKKEADTKSLQSQKSLQGQLSSLQSRFDKLKGSINQSVTDRLKEVEKKQNNGLHEALLGKLVAATGMKLYKLVKKEAAGDYDTFEVGEDTYILAKVKVPKKEKKALKKATNKKSRK